MTRRIHLPALLMLAITTTASASATEVRATDRPMTRQIDPRLAERMADRLSTKLMVNPDGSYISDINGRGRPLVFRNGMTLVINGRGFDQRKAQSMVSLYDGDKWTGAALAILSWTDVQVTARIAPDQNVLTQNTLNARLLLQGVSTSSYLTRFEVRNIRFVVP
ncbi:hypothetical protein ACVWZA_004270 [Sphingomonas sp. UYAg733]